MNTLRHQPESADEEAALWAARLEGRTLSADDRDALDAWLSADASHRALLSRYCQFSADLEEQLLALVATGGVQLPPESSPAPRRAKLIPWLGGLTLAAAAAVALALWVTQPKVQNISTAAAQRQTLALDDGTRVELNARTALSVELSRSERHVKLAVGEAFFTVSKDPSRPFIVETPSGSVRVTGTVFDVRTEAARELEVTVVEGSVQVRAAGQTEPYALAANDRLIAHGDKVDQHPLTVTELERALAWRRGIIVFDNTPLPEALERFARYHDRKIIPATTVLARNLTIGGPFSIDDLDGFLNGLKATHKLRPEYQPNGTIRVYPSDEP